MSQIRSLGPREACPGSLLESRVEGATNFLVTQPPLPYQESCSWVPPQTS